MLEDLRRKLHAHADVHAVGLRADAKLRAHALHPLAAAAANGNDALLTGEAPRVRDDLIAAVLSQNAPHRRAEMEIDLLLQLLEQVRKDNEVDVRAEMAHGGVQQMEVVLQAAGLEGAVRRGIELRTLAAVGDVDLINVVHQLQRLLFADVLVERTAEIVGDVVFSVGKGSGSAEAVHDRTGRTANAALHVFAVDGAFALFERLALLKDGDLLLRAELRQLIGRKNTAGTGTDDDYVILHGVHPFEKIVLRNAARAFAA